MVMGAVVVGKEPQRAVIQPKKMYTSKKRLKSVGIPDNFRQRSVFMLTKHKHAHFYSYRLRASSVLRMQDLVIIADLGLHLHRSCGGTRNENGGISKRQSAAAHHHSS